MGIGIVAKVVAHNSIRATHHGQPVIGIYEPRVGELIVERSPLIGGCGAREADAAGSVARKHGGTGSAVCNRISNTIFPHYLTRTRPIGNLVEVVSRTIACEDVSALVGHISDFQAHGRGQLSLYGGVPSVQSW